MAAVKVGSMFLGITLLLLGLTLLADADLHENLYSTGLKDAGNTATKENSATDHIIKIKLQTRKLSMGKFHKSDFIGLCSDSPCTWDGNCRSHCYCPPRGKTVCFLRGCCSDYPIDSKCQEDDDCPAECLCDEITGKCGVQIKSSEETQKCKGFPVPAFVYEDENEVEGDVAGVDENE